MKYFLSTTGQPPSQVGYYVANWSNELVQWYPTHAEAEADLEHEGDHVYELNFWDTPLGKTIGAAQDREVSIYPWGTNDVGTHALIVGPNEITIASVMATNGSVGRFHVRRETWDESEDFKAMAATDFPRRV